MRKKSTPKKLSLSVSDTIDTKENLTNYKKWFNGMKKFSSIRLFTSVKESGRDKPE